MALFAGGLTSVEAKAFFETLQSPDALLPAVRITSELETKATARLAVRNAESVSELNEGDGIVLQRRDDRE